LKSLEAVFGPNSALVEELYDQYKEDPNSVPAHWKNFFDEHEGKSANGESSQKTEKASAPAPAKQEKAQKKEESSSTAPKNAELEKIKGVATKIVENMDLSLEVPTATSLRVLPVKMMIEDRTVINTHLLQRNEPKASFTHFIAWAIIKALEEFPGVNNAYHFDGDNHFKVVLTRLCRTDQQSTFRKITDRRLSGNNN
jgi:2-oxoglutarate dehydrogenase E1 component